MESAAPVPQPENQQSPNEQPKPEQPAAEKPMFPPIVADSAHQNPKKKLLTSLIVLLIVAGLGGGGTWYYLRSKTRDNQQKPQASVNDAEKVPQAQKLTPDEAFKRMLEENGKVSTYHVSTKHTTKSRDGTNASEYDKTYNYEADVDVSDLRAMKLKATFDLNRSGKQAKGETVWLGEDVYLKLTEALVTDYQDIPCFDQKLRTAKSPTISALKAGFVKTLRSDQTLNCGQGAYQDFLNPITFGNTPFGDFPLFKMSALTDLEQRAFLATQNGQYRIYDGTLTELNGVEAYSYNVLIENYKISEMSKVLAGAAGFIDDDNHIIGFGEGDMGHGSPGRYLKVWVNAETNRLLRVQSIVDTPDVDIMFNTVVDFSKYNEQLAIQAPAR